MWNTHRESGIGAVVPWQGSLWAITYAPHFPAGSSDKLYEITAELEQRVFEGSVGGTPANRMIHPESDQLLIGPYLINAEKAIRVIPPSEMFGRLTGNARHLTDPKNKVYYATMEEGLYEVDVRSLEVKCLIRDGNQGAPETGIASRLPGYHGKGLYASQGRLVYANNGDQDPRVKVDPTVESGGLAEWFGEGDWQLVRRNQFTEVTGPGGIAGNQNPATDTIWAMGWDERSLLLALLEDESWHYYRLPKGSHSYDGAHGWNTEWPRIREIGEKDLLATMHGTFWRFPADFSRKRSAGIAPRSNYLKVVGDFCRWGDRLVIGCDDSAAGEFLNTRPFKAERGAPLQSNSNLWFIDPATLDDLGPVIGRGSVWLRDAVEADRASDPFLFSGYDHRLLHLTHRSEHPVTFSLEVDRQGTDQWTTLDSLTVLPGQAISHPFASTDRGVWIRLRPNRAASDVTAHFQYRDRDPRQNANAELFRGIATSDRPAASTGVMRSLAYDKLGLVASTGEAPETFTYYEIDSQLRFTPIDAPADALQIVDDVRQPSGTVIEDAASILLVEDGERYRLPKGSRDAARSVAVTEHPESRRPSDAHTQSRGHRQAAGQTLADYTGQNLLRGARIAVSSVLDDYAREHVTDGDLEDDQKRWVSSGDAAAWIAFELAESQQIRSLWIVSGWEGRASHVASDFDIQIPDGESWTTVQGGEIRGNRAERVEVVFPAAITTSELRVLAKKPGHFRIYEIAAFDRILDLPGQAFSGFGPARICREVATERDLLNVRGTFYELPARNAQGLAKVRPIATHHLAIQDFCSHNGLLFFTGLDAGTESEHVFRSEDGKAAVWVGVIDDLWKLGKPRGEGGPWKDTAVQAGVPSDRYLMTGYDRKFYRISVTEKATIRLEVDVDGTGLWIPYDSFELDKGGEIEGSFPDAFSAYWVRAISDRETLATVTFRYD